MDYLKSLFSGRLNRLGYILGSIYALIIFLIIYISLNLIYVFILHLFIKNPSHNLMFAPSYIFVGIFYGLLILANLSLAARRLHDTDYPTYLSLLIIIPFVNIPLTIYLMVAPSQPAPNQYGDIPSSHKFSEIFRYEYLKKKSND